MTAAERVALERDAADWLRAAGESVVRGRLTLEALPEALRAFAGRVDEELALPIDNGPGFGGVARAGWER